MEKLIRSDATAAVDVAPQRSRRKDSKRADRLLVAVTVLITILVVYLVVVPLVILVYSSLKGSGTELPFEVEGFSFENFQRIFTSSRLVEVSLNSLCFVAGSVILSLVVSAVLAYLFERTNIPGRRFFAPAALAPMAVPATVMAVAWVLAANPSNGPIALLIERVTGIEMNIYSISGMILVSGVFGVPSAYLMIAPTVARLNLELEEAAATAGATWATRTRIVVLPLIKPAILAAGMLSIVVTLEEFAIPAILGMPEKIFVFSTLIQASLQPPSGLANYGQASAYGVILVVLSIVMILVYRRQIKETHRYRVISGKGYRSTPLDLGRWRYPIAIVVAIYLLITIILPICTLIWTSLMPYLQPIGISSLSGLTFKNYAAIFANPALGHSVLNTLVISVLTASFVTILSLWLAVNSARGSRFGQFIFDMSFLVFGIPSIVLGAAILFMYLFLPIPIYGTIWIIIVALTTRYLPRGSRMVESALLQLDPGLEESARVSGAGQSTVIRRIIFPLTAPALSRTWLWVFTHALGELPISLLLASANNRTVVVHLWDMIGTNADYPQASALAVLLLVISALSVWWVNRRGVQEQHI